MTKRTALVIRAAGDPAVFRGVGAAFESAELRRLRLENAALRRNRDALRRMEIEALGREVEAYLHGRRATRRVQQAFWRLVGAACVLAGRMRGWRA